MEDDEPRPIDSSTAIVIARACGELARDDFAGRPRPVREIDQLTLDTNVIRDYWDQRPRKDSIEELLALAEIGRVELVVTRYIEEDVPRTPLRDRINELEAPRVGKTGGLFTIGSSALGGADFFGSDAFDKCRVALRGWRPSKGRPPDDRDWKHLHAHYAKRRDYFLTWDGPLLELGSILEHGFPLGVRSPDDYLAHAGCSTGALGLGASRPAASPSGS